MKGFIAFTKKEYTEQLRTYRWLILPCVFFLFGMMSPLLAKLMPEIISGMEVEGFTITMPEPTVMDAYSQFFKNINQMGVIIILLIFGGVISNELAKGTLINILAKGLPRYTVILSKYTAALSLWTVSLCLGALTNYGYTLYLFDESKVKNLFFSLFCIWMFGLFLLSLIFLSSALIGGSFGGLILTAIILGGLMLVNIFPNMKTYNPMYLSSYNLELLTGSLTPRDFIKPLLITAVLLLGCLYTSIRLFGKKKL
jgi:ABC-2 type transport system permease protein